MKRILFFLAIIISLNAFGQGIVLKATNETLELATSTTADIDYSIEWYDVTSAGAGLAQTSEGKITTATTTVILAAPAASTSRHIKKVTLFNIHATASNVLTVKKDIATVEYRRFTVTLAFGEHAKYSDDEGWMIYNLAGKFKTIDREYSITGLTRFVGKTTTAGEASGYWYCASKDAGIPGAWVPGTPGMAGRVTAGTSVTDAGCISFPTTSNTRYLTSVDISTTVVNAFVFMDILWVNSGITVTTTTAQTINSVALPARDDNGSINGEGCRIGLLAVAALGNAATVANSTVSYTNSAGTAGRTATLSAVVGSQIPATPVIGTVVWFDLQSGDKGVKSIETITLATTLTSGTASLIIARPLVTAPVALVNQVANNVLNKGDGVRLYDDACIHPFFQCVSTPASTFTAALTSSEK